MKSFFRTVGGKALLFAACILALCLLAASAALAVFLLSETEFYTAPETELRETFLSRPLRSYGFGLVEDALHLPSGGETVGPDWGNAVWQVEDGAGTVLFRSRSAGEAQTWEFRFRYGYDPAADSLWNLSSRSWQEPSDAESYTVSYALKEGLPVPDELALISRLVRLGRSLRYAVFPIALLALALAAAAFVGLMCVSARRPGTEALCPGPLHRVPFDLLLALCFFGMLLLCLLADWLTRYDAVTAAAIVLLCFLGANLVLGLCMSAAARIKERTLLKNTVIALCLRGLWRLLRWLGRLLGSVTLVWKLALGFVGLSLVELLFIAMFWPDLGPWSVFWCAEKLVLFPLLLALALQLRRLQKGAEALAAGDLGYQTDTGHMLPPLRAHGENLNSIAGGMAAAVEKQLKSERMKTELITNVSHDLKTPLTSIVNYAELIGNEAPGSEKTGEYAKVLLRQAERMKRLIEDLVEASKAATGNLEVDPVPCDAGVFLSQAAGEYEERFRNAGLRPVVKLPEEELTIRADGRRMWRIFDNLLGNVVKYAMAGTRVYLSLEEKAGQAVFTFKNTSREPLNVPAEELTERFVRGDASRSTEGSGLGLSIARSMAELQQGALDLTVDGDLFKATLSFPLLP